MRLKRLTKCQIVGQQRYHSNNNLLTTVSKGSGLHLLLGRDEVFRTLAVGFLHKKTVLINRLFYSQH